MTTATGVSLYIADCRRRRSISRPSTRGIRKSTITASNFLLSAAAERWSFRSLSEGKLIGGMIYEAMRDIQELSYQEIADALRLPEGTVKSRINRGRTELARQIRRLRGDDFSPNDAGARRPAKRTGAY